MSKYYSTPSPAEQKVAKTITGITKKLAKLFTILEANPEDVETREAADVLMLAQQEIIKAWKDGAATQEDLDYIDRTGEVITEFYASLTAVQDDFIQNHAI